jgi:hypothetical protein
VVKPKELSKLDVVLSTNVSHLMPTKEPDYAEYRENWHRSKSWGSKLFMDMFYRGLTSLALVPKVGIDSDAALKHIRAIMSSWEPKHEDKVASCTFLFEHWFESATWEPKPRKSSCTQN